MKKRVKNRCIPSGMPHGKATAAESAARLEIIKRALIDAKTRYAIIQFCAEKWGIKTRQVDVLIARATNAIEIEFAPRRGKEVMKHIARRERIFDAAITKKDLWLALKADDSLAKLKGLLVDTVILPASKRLEIVDEADEEEKQNQTATKV